MAQKQYSVSLQCCYTVGAFPIRKLYCIIEETVISLYFIINLV